MPSIAFTFGLQEHRRSRSPVKERERDEEQGRDRHRDYRYVISLVHFPLCWHRINEKYDGSHNLDLTVETFCCQYYS